MSRFCSFSPLAESIRLIDSGEAIRIYTIVNELKMTDNQKIFEAIYIAIDEVNEQLPKGGQIEKTSDTPLFGSEGMLDSLGLVNLIVAIEQQVEEQLDAVVTLADEKAVSQRNSPFRTVGTLATYIEAQLSGEDK